MVRVRITTLLVIMACLTLSIAHADDRDVIAERLYQAHEAYHAEIELIRAETVKELETKEAAERKRTNPDLERIKSLKNEREQLETNGKIPGSSSAKIKGRINKSRATFVSLLTVAKNAYIRDKRDADAEAVSIELQKFQAEGILLVKASAKLSWPDPKKPWGKPAFLQWANQVAALPAQKQVEAVTKKLVELNPGFDGDVKPGFEGETVTGVVIPGSTLTDLSPLRALRGLKVLACSAGKLTDLSPLRGMPLTNIAVHSTKVSDLSPLKGMPLTHFGCSHTPVADLSPLKGMPLVHLYLNGTAVTDLSIVKGMPLAELEIQSTKIADLSPLKGLPLSIINCTVTPVSDLTPLRGMRLTYLNCAYTRVADLAPLKGMPLRQLYLNGTAVTDLSLLQGMPLTEFAIHSTKISDLSPLKGMPLTNFGCADTPVSDLTPLRGMPLTSLWFHRSKVTDYSLLKELPLTDVYLDFDPARDTKLLRSIKTLTKINNIPVAEFWKKLEAPEKK
ncbi:MAG: pknB 22 [Planctomycetaceae bacterium]|nr:pknB 22 [Planctomycetaceae bacterium]